MRKISFALAIFLSAGMGYRACADDCPCPANSNPEDKSCDYDIGGVANRLNVKSSWSLQNATVTNPAGAAFVYGFATFTGTSVPCVFFHPREIVTDSAATTVLGQTVSVAGQTSTNGPGLCNLGLLNNGTIGGAKFSANAVVNSTSGSSQTNGESLFAFYAGADRRFCVPFDPPAPGAWIVCNDRGTTAEPGIAIATTLWSAEQVCRTNPALPVVFQICIETGFTNEPFACTLGNPYDPLTFPPNNNFNRFNAAAATVVMRSGSGAPFQVLRGSLLNGASGVQQNGLFLGSVQSGCNGAFTSVELPISATCAPISIDVNLTQRSWGGPIDADNDGDLDCDDVTLIHASRGLVFGDTGYSITLDLNFDGVINDADVAIALAEVPYCPVRCSPADIAYDDGTPLPPSGPQATSSNGLRNNGITEADFNLFFAGFFDAEPYCDIAYDDGTPLPPFGPAGGVNNGVTEGDYNLFFGVYFDGCP
jgi:hypothetical protein